MSSLPDQSTRTRIPWGPSKGKQMCQARDADLRYLIRRARSSYINNAAYDEYAYRWKLGLIGENP